MTPARSTRKTTPAPRRRRSADPPAAAKAAAPAPAEATAAGRSGTDKSSADRSARPESRADKSSSGRSARPQPRADKSSSGRSARPESRADKSSGGRSGSSDAEPRRLHAGRTYEERRAERREALLETGLELFGTKGYRAVTIEEICRVSHVTTRYFYEEFASRDALLLALYDKLMGELLPLTRAVERHDEDRDAQTRARLAATIHAMVDDPRVARVLYVESVGVSPELEQRRRDWHRGFAWAMAEKAQLFEPDTSRAELELRGLAAVGILDEIIVDHFLRAEPLDIEFIIDCVHRMFVALGADVVLMDRPPGEPAAEFDAPPHNPEPPSTRRPR